MTHDMQAALHAIRASPHTEPELVEVTHVHDGDTFGVIGPPTWKPFRVWLVRLGHCDAPELGDVRPDIRAIAEAAHVRLTELLAAGGVILTSIRHDEYGGRLLCDASAGCVEDVAKQMIAETLARPWEGRGHKPW